MKILYLSPVHLSLTPGDPLPRWQTQASHVRALKSLGHMVTVLPYSSRMGSGTLRERIVGNLGVLGVLGKFDVIMLSLGADVLFPATVRLLLARLRAPLVILSGVSPVSMGNPRERALAPLSRLVVTNDPSHAKQWSDLGARRTITLPISAADPELHYPRSNSHRDVDVVFAGTVSEDRESFFRELRRFLPSSVSVLVKQFVWEDAYATLLSRAKIALNPIRPSMKHGANLRLFEIPAFGALELSSYSQDSWLIPGIEIVTYESPKGAAWKIVYYLNHPKERERIDRAGMKRVMREHAFVNRFRKLIEMINSLTH